MIQHKAYKFRIYPNKEQKILLEKTFGCVRFVYNHYLALRKEVYETEKRTFSYKECTKDLVSLKKESSFLKEVDSISLQQSLRHLDHAFGRFFADRNCGYPRFKSKKDHRVSYTTMCVNGNIRLTGRQIILPKVKGLNIRQHRDIPEGHRLKSVTVSRTPTGKYYVSILCEYEAGERREKYDFGQYESDRTGLLYEEPVCIFGRRSTDRRRIPASLPEDAEKACKRTKKTVTLSKGKQKVSKTATESGAAA